MAKHFYPAVLEHGAKGTVAAWFPDFPDCVAAGHTQDEAMRKADHVLAQAVDSRAERDIALPQPTPIEQIVLPKGARFIAFFIVGVEPPDPSERVNVYLPRSLIARVDRRAEELGMSRSSFFGLAASMMIGNLAGVGTYQAATQPRTNVEQVGDLNRPPPPSRRKGRRSQE